RLLPYSLSLHDALPIFDIVSDDQENNLQTQLVGDADSYDLSPSGKRAVVSVRGELFTVATEKGDIRRLTSTPKERETGPQWSPEDRKSTRLNSSHVSIS